MERASCKLWLPQCRRDGVEGGHQLDVKDVAVGCIMGALEGMDSEDSDEYDVSPSQVSR
jgi:hypothetical protein